MFAPNYEALAKLYLEQKESRILSTLEDGDLSDQQLFWLNYKNDILDLSIRDDYLTQFPRDLSFTWVVTEYSDSLLKLQL